MDFKKLNNIFGLLMFIIATAVYALSAEPAGSLWDCGEFISSAYKMQVPHPPGAPLFVMIGRLFAWTAELFSKDPSSIAFAVNLLSGVCTAVCVMFIFWTTTMLAKMMLVGRDEELTETGDIIATLASGVVAGLATTFATSVWFSAVEGEVYAMSAAFTGLTLWASFRFYTAPEDKNTDRWLIFLAFILGLSSTVHLLSLLIIPVITLLYYYKRYENTTLVGTLASLGAGVGLLGVFQFFLIPVVPGIGAWFDRFFNDMGMPIGYGLLIFTLLLAAGFAYGIYYTQVKGMATAQKWVLGFAMVMLGFSCYTEVYVRANANTPINMNDPSDPYSLVSYLKREQYGQRPLFYGPHFMAQRNESESYRETGDEWRPVNGKYEVVSHKGEALYRPEDYMLFPRMGHSDEGQVQGYRNWLGLAEGEAPSQIDNINFLLRYQIGWMYVRYFMWNFVGRQNAEQGYFSGDPSSGNWLSGVTPIDNARLYNESKMPQSWKDDPSRNKYYFLPLIFGLLGMFFHFMRRQKEASVVLLCFLMTGLAIVFYINEPPIEPRERDYGHAGSIFTFTIWIGLAVAAIYSLLKEKVNLAGMPSSIVAAGLVITAPLIMGSQNWDDHSRAGHYAARDYARNFLMSVEKDAIIFTYGDNDTYPLWYCQEVEGIRRDVRVVNFSLLAVDWYINQLRRKINDSPAIKMTISEDAYRGDARNVLYNMDRDGKKEMSLADVVKYMGEKHEMRISSEDVVPSTVPASNVFIDIDPAKAKALGLISKEVNDSLIVKQMKFKLPKSYLQKDDIALMDIISTNLMERPVYFAVTVRPEKIGGLSPYLQLEGLGLRIVPIETQPDRAVGGVLGYGRVDCSKSEEIVMNNWRFGNFEKGKTFIDKNYMPSVQSMQIVMLRLSDEYLRRSDKEKSNAVCKKYFEGFPEHNFPFERSQSITFMQNLIEGGDVEFVKDKLIALSNELKQDFDFYSTLTGMNELSAWSNANQQLRLAQMRYQQASAIGDPTLLDGTKKEFAKANAAAQTAEAKLADKQTYYFKDDYNRYMSMASNLMRLVEKFPDAATKDKVTELLSPYIGVQNVPN